MKFGVLGITSLLCVCKAAADVAADSTAKAASVAAASKSVVDSVVNAAADEDKIDETIVSDATASNEDVAASDAIEPSNPEEPLAEIIEGEAHHEEEHHEEEHHDLSEAFGIMDENGDGVLQKEEIIIAIERSAHHVEINPEEYADKLMPKEEAVDADGNQSNSLFNMATFTEMIKKASEEEIKEGEVPSLNQQMSQLASDVLVSYYYYAEEQEEPVYDASAYYNPHNMTYEELEYHLYEWEEGAVGHVSEYFDWEVFERMRNQEDDYYKEDEEHEEEDDEEKKQTLKDQEHHDDGSKTKVDMRKSNTDHYLNLSNDVAHVVEFYAPWCPHCQHFSK